MRSLDFLFSLYTSARFTLQALKIIYYITLYSKLTVKAKHKIMRTTNTHYMYVYTASYIDPCKMP